MWIFSSLESSQLPASAEETEQIFALFSKAQELESEYDHKRETPGLICVGSMDERVLKVLQSRDGLVKDCTEPHYKFAFEVENLPPVTELPSGYKWSQVHTTDIPLVLSRTSIPRKP